MGGSPGQAASLPTTLAPPVAGRALEFGPRARLSVAVPALARKDLVARSAKGFAQDVGDALERDTYMSASEAVKSAA